MRHLPPHHERKIPGYPEIQEVFPARQSLISDIDISGFPDCDGVHSSTYICNSVYEEEVEQLTFQIPPHQQVCRAKQEI